MSGSYGERVQKSQALGLTGEVERRLSVTVMSFGYKEGPPPLANMVFDVRFLKNPYWVPELRPLSGRDAAVQQYVVKQPLALDFLDSLSTLLAVILPRFVDLEIGEFTLALGCTGGQHRSVALVEAVADRLERLFPIYQVIRIHRELAAPFAPDSSGMAVSPGTTRDVQEQA